MSTSNNPPEYGESSGPLRIYGSRYAGEGSVNNEQPNYYYYENANPFQMHCIIWVSFDGNAAGLVFS